MNLNKKTFEKSFLKSKFLTIDYLRDGNDRQKCLFNEVSKLNLLNFFALFNPIIVGTIPIEIDIPSSDVDLIIDLSKADIITYYVDFISNNKNFILESKIIIKTKSSFIAQFKTKYFNYEIYGECKETIQQFGFIHMVVENEILKLLGEDFKQSIINLKNKETKTEIAFCKMLGIDKDQYEYLYNLKDFSLDDFSKEINLIYKRARNG